MLTDSEIQRMEAAKSTTARTNCIGTVLFVMGASEDDTYIGIGERRWDGGIVYSFLEKMKKVKTPRIGDILVIGGEKVEHMGIIVQEEPLRVFQRCGINGPIQPNVPLREVIRKYREYRTREIYSKSPPAQD